MKELRLLRANEIDVRVGTINEKGATLLLYKDARVDMNILDESKMKWKRSHELINGNLFCTISVWDDDIKEWISRQDVGVESNTEKEKGQASDAFKRAGFNFGIGRELYTAPFTWISADNYSSFKNPKTGNLSTYDKFEVTNISYDENRNIIGLEIKNVKTHKAVYSLGKDKPSQPIKNEALSLATTEQKQQIANLMAQEGILTKEDIKDTLATEYGIIDTDKMSFDDARMVLDDFKEKKKELESEEL